LIEHQHIHCII